MEKQNTLLIINPIAGRKKARTILYKVVDSLCRNNHKITIFTTTSKGEATQIIREYASDMQKIICCGGDGTLNEVLSGLSRENLQIPVGYIPTGTTNDLAHALGLSVNVKKAINVTLDGNIRKHDIGSFNENQYFSYIASFGAFTKVSYTTPQWIKNLIGHTAYILYGIFNLNDIHSHRVKVVADGNEISGDFIFGSVSNSTVIGGIVKLAKSDIHFDDGKFEVMLIRTPKNAKELKKIIQGLVHRRYDSRHVYFFKASDLSFHFEESVKWTIDGEYAGTANEVEIKNHMGLAHIMGP
ncbi:diacylglycerol/lipid kinase family protein [Scatolibacter rhodanostii]|uniref:diacylglycerol/lipid kinase family protein n=1 Tax=Scatolibacter rhodanostii TaxID=2014781 RepID=UPI000C06FB33|nr:YegS/Rv2252/BmrU family lipid kinase [Scatolibacter rhodanostii]